MEEQIKIRKVPIEALIDSLIHLYELGANYVDIIGTSDEEQDVIGLAVKDEYLMEDYDDLPDLEDPDTYSLVKQVKLTDEDINNLL